MSDPGFTPAQPPASISAPPSALPSFIQRGDYLFLGGLTAMALLPLLLIVLSVMYQKWRSSLHQRRVQLLEKLWLMTVDSSPPLK